MGSWGCLESRARMLRRLESIASWCELLKFALMEDIRLSYDSTALGYVGEMRSVLDLGAREEGCRFAAETPVSV